MEIFDNNDSISIKRIFLQFFANLRLAAVWSKNNLLNNKLQLIVNKNCNSKLNIRQMCHNANMINYIQHFLNNVYLLRFKYVTDL